MSRRKRMMEDLDQDIRDYIERETQDDIERGMPPEEARYAALRKFGNVSPRFKQERIARPRFPWTAFLLVPRRRPPACEADGPCRGRRPSRSAGPFPV